MMLPGKKKQHELLFLEYFRRSFPGFPKGKIIVSESPDFIIAENPRLLTGIELTALFPHNDPSFHASLRRETPEKVFIETVRGRVVKDCPRPVLVRFLFSGVHPPDDALVLGGAVRTAVAIRRILGKRNPAFFSATITKEELPSFLDAVLVMHGEAMEHSAWGMAARIATGEKLLADLAGIIQAKEEKLRNGPAGTTLRNWLLITADTLSAGNEQNVWTGLKGNLGTTGFQRVFLFDLLRAKVHVLV